MTRITILTQYYPPETGAPQNRLHSLSKYLVGSGMDVSVVTALPNYPQNKIFNSYKGRYSVNEVIDSVQVFRTWIYVSRSRSITARLFNYFSFVITSFFKLIVMPKADVIVCESPPLFLGITAVVISKLKRSRLIINVSDLWPESAEKLNLVSNKTLLSMAYFLEGWIYKHAFMITGQTKGIVTNIKSRFPQKDVIWFPNGVDLTLFENEGEHVDWRNKLSIPETDFVLLYAGIIGYAQGLDVILMAAEELKAFPTKFLIVGDGPEKERLEAAALGKTLTNVIFHSNIEKKLMPSLIKASDAYIVPLKKLELFKGAIPSKLFEPLALGKPILLGVDGEAREIFIEEGRTGIYFEPENSSELVAGIMNLLSDRRRAEALGQQGRAFVKLNFNRNEINRNIAKLFA